MMELGLQFLDALNCLAETKLLLAQFTLTALVLLEVSFDVLVCYLRYYYVLLLRDMCCAPVLKKIIDLAAVCFLA